MTTFAPAPFTLTSLSSKVIVLTGGSSGIGASIIRLFHSLGALIVFGDTNSTLATTLISSLPASPYPQSNVSFLETDARSYPSTLALFAHAEFLHGHIDHALAIAGVAEHGDWFGASLSRATVSECPTTLTLDVNLLGMLYFSRIAIAFLTDPATRKDRADRSLTIMGSSASFRPPSIVLYGTSKHGVLGMARGLHEGVGRERGVRVNTIMPWMTGGTAILPGYAEEWKRAGLPLNEVEDVARVARELVGSEGMSGKAVYVEGGRAWDLVESMERTAGVWWGPGVKEAYDRSRENAELMRFRAQGGLAGKNERTQTKR